MSANRKLISAAFLLAVLWTVAMLWWQRPTAMAGFAIQAIAGVIVGILWYIGMRLWTACCARR